MLLRWYEKRPLLGRTKLHNAKVTKVGRRGCCASLFAFVVVACRRSSFHIPSTYTPTHQTRGACIFPSASYQCTHFQTGAASNQLNTCSILLAVQLLFLVHAAKINTNGTCLLTMWRTTPATWTSLQRPRRSSAQANVHINYLQMRRRTTSAWQHRPQNE